ncbi:hypothetical protein SEA_KEANU_106 [Streptomyces phage Keanu]|nr:hypothetical protein SEA_KEANU_106 [Streptomyces phage Keanu]
MRENLGFKTGDVVIDGDGYEAKIVEIDPSSFVAILDYSDFPADVPAEATDWDLEDLALADEDAETERTAEVAEHFEG